MLNRASIPTAALHGELSQGAPPAQDAHGGVKGKRKSKKDKLREAAAAAALSVTRKP